MIDKNIPIPEITVKSSWMDIACEMQQGDSVMFYSEKGKTPRVQSARRLIRCLTIQDKRFCARLVDGGKRIWCTGMIEKTEVS